MKFVKFNLQMFKGNVSSTTTYTASPEERALLQKQMEYLDEIFPNMVKLNERAGENLWDSYADVQADYGSMNNAAQQQIANAQTGLENLGKGILPQEYIDNETKAVQSSVQNSVGDLINSMGSRGVINSSITNQGLNDISKNVADAVTQNYNNGLTTLGSLYNDQITNAGQNIAVSSAAQDAAINIPKQMWQLSLGLDSANTGTLSSIAGKYGTTTTNKSGGSGGLGSLLGGVATGLAGNSGLWSRQ